MAALGVTWTVPMMADKPKITAVVALGVIVLLVVFGIDRIGGETWVSAAASAQAGWRAGWASRAAPAASVLRQFLVPLLMVAAILAVAALGAILNRLSRADAEETGAPPRP